MGGVVLNQHWAFSNQLLAGGGRWSLMACLGQLKGFAVAKVEEEEVEKEVEGAPTDSVVLWCCARTSCLSCSVSAICSLLYPFSQIMCV